MEDHRSDDPAASHALAWMGACIAGDSPWFSSAPPVLLQHSYDIADLHAGPNPVLAFECLLPLVDRDVGVGVIRAQVLGAGADQAVVVELLDHMRGPAADARHGEDRA